MKELINNELAQLQKDLENLQSASRMIAQAGEASNGVIAEAKEIHEDFSKNLENLTNLYTQYLDAANKQSSQNQLLVVDHIKKTITEQNALLQKSSDLVEKNASDAALKVETVKETYLKQSAETGKLLSSYLELAQSTAELKDKIQAVNFPERLDNINTSSEAMQKKYEALSANYDAVKAEVADITKRVDDVQMMLAKVKDHQKEQDDQLAKILTAASSDANLKQAKANSKEISSVKTLLVTTLIFVIIALAGIAFIYLKK